MQHSVQTFEGEIALPVFAITDVLLWLNFQNWLLNIRRSIRIVS